MTLQQCDTADNRLRHRRRRSEHRLVCVDIDSQHARPVFPPATPMLTARGIVIQDIATTCSPYDHLSQDADNLISSLRRKNSRDRRRQGIGEGIRNPFRHRPDSSHLTIAGLLGFRNGDAGSARRQVPRRHRRHRHAAARIEVTPRSVPRRLSSASTVNETSAFGSATSPKTVAMRVTTSDLPTAGDFARVAPSSRWRRIRT